MILVSACLAGINCKYSGGNNYNEKVFNETTEKDMLLLQDNNIFILKKEDYYIDLVFYNYILKCFVLKLTL